MCGREMELVKNRRNGEILDENYSIWWKCPDHCFGDDFPLIEHGVDKGLQSAPGDSWSLTWLK
jgi:hypothetical protein